jgi:hypothetical protein
MLQVRRPLPCSALQYWVVQAVCMLCGMAWAAQVELMRWFSFLAAGRSVSDKCQQDVAIYKLERSKHINRDVALGKQ